MIADNIRNYRDYCVKGSNLEKGFEFLLNKASENLPDGRVEIDGDKCFALVQSYTTAKPELKRWETHNVYLDIQYVITGREIAGYVPKNELDVEEDQTPKADVIFYKQAHKGMDVVLGPGDFAVFYPQDGHKPGVICGKPEQMKKIVVKVKK
jgi:biofilm protein TabA